MLTLESTKGIVYKKLTQTRNRWYEAGWLFISCLCRPFMYDLFVITRICVLFKTSEQKAHLLEDKPLTWLPLTLATPPSKSIPSFTVRLYWENIL